ncbi:MAG: hypothetical protein WD988_00705 [Candidatus Curtissbacteria bacterium]
MSESFLTNIEIVLYALFLLGGTTKKIPYERIAIKSFELDRSRFSWRLYPEYPDAEITRKALSDAKRTKNGGLVRGRYGRATGDLVADGWIFTPEGIIWVEKNRMRVAQSLGINQNQVNRTEISKKLKELESSVAFKKYLHDNACMNIKPYEFTDFLNASLDTPPSILRDRIDKLSALAKTGKKQKLLDFITQCEKHFPNLLGL